MLEPLGVDLVELSGGSYESPAMTGRPADARTAAREAYFLELAAELAESSPLPLMLTGGITPPETAEDVLASGVDDGRDRHRARGHTGSAERWRAGARRPSGSQPVTWSDKTLASAASMAMVRHQMRRITRGKEPTGQDAPGARARVRPARAAARAAPLPRVAGRPRRGRRMSAAASPTTTEVELGGHRLRVPAGGYYDRHRMRAGLDEVARDPAVPSVAFFRSLPKRVVESPIGPTATPNFYYAIRMAQVGLLAPIGAVRRRLPDALEPLQPVPGFGLVALVFYAYDVCDIDLYNEATVAIACRPPRHGGPAALDVAQGALGGTTYGYSLALPVTTEIARVRGVHGYALPKWRTAIDVAHDARTFRGRVAGDAGETDVELSLPLPRLRAHRPGAAVRTTVALSRIDGAWHETRTLFHALSSGARALPRGVRITTGRGRMSEELAALGPVRPVLAEVITSGQVALNMPVPVSVA